MAAGRIQEWFGDQHRGLGVRQLFAQHRELRRATTALTAPRALGGQILCWPKGGAIERLSELFDRELRRAGYLAHVRATVSRERPCNPKQRNTRARSRHQGGPGAGGLGRRNPAMLRQKNRDALWTIKTTTPNRARADRHPSVAGLLAVDMGRGFTPQPRSGVADGKADRFRKDRWPGRGRIGSGLTEG